MFTFIVIGFILRRKNIIPENSSIVLSKLQTNLFMPALIINTFMQNCNITAFMENSMLILYGFALIIIALLVAYPVSALFIKNSKESSELAFQRDIYKYSLTFGNFGYVGSFLMLGVFGSGELFKYQMFSIGLNVVVYSWGLYILIPKDKNCKNPLKYLINPLMFAVVFGILAGLLNLRNYIPEFLTSSLSNASNCMGPVAMVIAGIVIAGFDFKSLLSSKKVYIATLLRLIVIPSIMVLGLMALGTNKEIITLVLFAFAAPLGLNTVVYPSAYGGDSKTGASMALISHTLSVITIPIMYFIFVVLL
jgi:predicted permease